MHIESTHAIVGYLATYVALYVFIKSVYIFDVVQPCRILIMLTQYVYVLNL